MRGSFPAKARGVLPGAGGRGGGELPRRPRAAGARGGGGRPGGVASEPICRPQARRAGHQLPAPLLRPDEPAQRGHRSPARSRASRALTPTHPGPRDRLRAASKQMERQAEARSSALASL